ncbi:MAG: RlmE family RNA methyltransferase [Burkholderia sp.]|nr:RlmE family RNA methyltransferase [Burkholderia sp.]
MTKNSFNKRWLNNHIKDPYVKMAKLEGYRARSAYKLKEIDEQDKLIHHGQIIVDLGSSPGSWSQYMRNKLAQKIEYDPVHDSTINGIILALDILPMKPISNVNFIQGDLLNESVLYQLKLALKGRSIDLVTSDIAPNLSGVSIVDAVRIGYVCDFVLEFSQNHLKPTGTLLFKCFHGSGYSQIINKFKYQFEVVWSRKPKASLTKSSEIFILGRHLKHNR